MELIANEIILINLSQKTCNSKLIFDKNMKKSIKTKIYKSNYYNQFIRVCWFTHFLDNNVKLNYNSNVYLHKQKNKGMLLNCILFCKNFSQSPSIFCCQYHLNCLVQVTWSDI